MTSSSFKQDLAWMHRPFAHRGLHDSEKGIIENSSSAVQAAIDHGFAIEVDLQPARGDEPMVFHDAALDRLTEEKGPIKARSKDELRSIYYKNSSDQLATLHDLLDQVQGQVPLLIEVKSPWIEALNFVERIAEDLSGYSGKTAIMSFDPHLVAAFAKKAPAIPRGIVAEKFDDMAYWGGLNWRQRFALRHLLWSPKARPQFIAYDVHHLPAYAPLIAKSVFGLKLLTWTVRTEDDRRTAELWADAMIFEGFLP